MRAIKTHLTVALLLCILLPSGLIGTTAYWLVFNSIRESRLKDVRQIADTRYNEMRIRLLEYNESSKNLLATLTSSCRYSDIGINACAQARMERFAAINQTVGLSLHSGIDSDISVGSDAIPRDKINSRFLPGQIAAISTSKINGASLLSMLIADPASGFSLVVTYPGQKLQDIFVSPPVPGQLGESFLIDNLGLFITKPRYPLQPGTIQHLSTVPMQRCLGKENSEILDFDYRGIPIIHGFRFVPEIGGGCIMAHIDRAEAFAPLAQWMVRLGVLIVFFVCCAGVIATMISRGMTKPIIALADMANAFAREDFPRQAASTSYPDGTELSQLFNYLAGQLGYSVSRLDASEYDLKKAAVELDKRHRKYHSVIQNTEEGFLHIDREGRLVEVNPAYARASGYSEAELVGMRIANLEAQETPEETTEHIRKIMRNGTDVFETQHRRKDGSVWDIEVYASFIEEDGGYVVGFFRDISDYKRAERLLKITHMTERKQMADALHSAEYKLQENQIKLAMQNNKLQSFYSALTESRSRYADLFDSAPIDSLTLADRELIVDITERNHLGCQLQQVQKMEVLGQLIGGIAHDFNNILAAILGYSNLALERCVPGPSDKLAHYLREVISASERARDLIAIVLDFSRTSPAVAGNPLDLALELEKAVALLSFAIPAGIEINTHIKPGVPPVRIDPIELQQVLINLSVNARDAIGEQGRIDVTLERTRVHNKTCAVCNTIIDGDYVALEVKDSGNGIPADIQQHIFDPFFTTKKAGKGSGLGLNMVQGIVIKNKAHLLVESSFEQGTSFRLLFPFAKKTEEAISTPQILIPIAPVTKHPKRWRIWVVENHESLAVYYQKLLQKQGYLVTVFTDPTKALYAFQLDSDGVDLVLTDQTMPYLNGLELAGAMLAVKPELAVVLVTGYSEAINADEAERIGIRCYLNKPVDGKKLLDTLAAELYRNGFA